MNDGAPHPCQGCGRTTVSADDFCAFCHNGYVRPDWVGWFQWQRGTLVWIGPQQ